MICNFYPPEKPGRFRLNLRLFMLTWQMMISIQIIWNLFLWLVNLFDLFLKGITIIKTLGANPTHTLIHINF